MEQFTVSLDLSAALAAPDSCPSCASPGLEPVTDGDRVTLRCPACFRRWEAQFGALALVDPDTSGPCAQGEGYDTQRPNSGSGVHR